MKTYTPRPSEQIQAIANALRDAAHRADSAEEKAKLPPRAQFRDGPEVARISGGEGERPARRRSLQWRHEFLPLPHVVNLREQALMLAGPALKPGRAPAARRTAPTVSTSWMTLWQPPTRSFITTGRIIAPQRARMPKNRQRSTLAPAQELFAKLVSAFQEKEESGTGVWTKIDTTEDIRGK